MSSGPQKQDEDAGQAGRAGWQGRQDATASMSTALSGSSSSCLYFWYVSLCCLLAWPSRETLTTSARTKSLEDFLDCAVAAAARAAARGGATSSICDCLGSVGEGKGPFQVECPLRLLSGKFVYPRVARWRFWRSPTSVRARALPLTPCHAPPTPLSLCSF